MTRATVFDAQSGQPEIPTDLQDVAHQVRQEFAGRLDAHPVDECSNRTAAKFTEANVRSFVPLLVQGYVRDELQDQPRASLRLIPHPSCKESHLMTWRNGSACSHENPELFFPIGNAGLARQQIEEAKVICRRCGVVQTCLKWAMDSGQDSGVWGGLSEDERHTLKRRNSRARRAGLGKAPVRGGPGIGAHLHLDQHRAGTRFGA